MNEQTLKFGDTVADKKEFHAPKQALALSFVDTDKIVLPGKFKYSDSGSKYFIGYLGNDDIIRALCIILPQMSGYIKHSDNGGKNVF